MQSLFQKGPPLTRHTHRHVWTILFTLPTMLGLLVGFGRLPTVYAEAPAPVPLSSFSPFQVALADFDGDVRPDSASIEGSSIDAGITKYSIELRLTEAGVQSLSLVAPAGGLWIEARDVNGDHAVDLVFATAWFKQPVAILLNDGHGRFSRAKAGAFPSAFRSSSQDWQFHPLHLIDAFGALVSSHSPQCGLPAHRCSLPANRLACAATAAPLSDFHVSYHRGRAPPLSL